MFTGIVQGIAHVTCVDRKPGLLSATIQFPNNAVTTVAHGASIAIDGVCLTVASSNNDLVGFDVMAETLDRTTLGTLTKGNAVNFERSLKFGDEVGGHIISGHIDGVATISKIETPENNRIITFKVPQQWMPYIFEKGYIGLNGASLTIAKVNSAECLFSVFLIPETLTLTTFATKKVGEAVNFEIDRQTQAIVDTVNRYLAEHGINRS